MIGFLPFYHIYGIQAIMLQCISRGDKIVSLQKFQKNEFVRAIREYKVLLISLVIPSLKNGDCLSQFKIIGFL